jgi:signal transduction histidine kinase
MRRLFRHCTLEVTVPDDVPSVLVDFTQIDLVLTNLLENAARHSPPGSVVALGVHACGREVVVEVTDQGSGIDPRLGDDVFTPFRSADGGTGIGLAICRSIVDAHGGTIVVGEPESGGARFIVTLPAAGADDDPGR